MTTKPISGIAPPYTDAMNKAAAMLDMVLHPYGFALIVFDTDGQGHVSFVANCPTEIAMIGVADVLDQFVQGNVSAYTYATKEG